LDYQINPLWFSATRLTGEPLLKGKSQVFHEYPAQPQLQYSSLALDISIIDLMSLRIESSLCWFIAPWNLSPRPQVLDDTVLICSWTSLCRLWIHQLLSSTEVDSGYLPPSDHRSQITYSTFWDLAGWSAGYFTWSYHPRFTGQLSSLDKWPYTKSEKSRWSVLLVRGHFVGLF